MEENKNPFQFINEEEITTPIVEEKEISTENNSEDTAEAFVTGLPEWDLTPPFEIIRRVNRQ